MNKFGNTCPECGTQVRKFAWKCPSCKNKIETKRKNETTFIFTIRNWKTFDKQWK